MKLKSVGVFSCGKIMGILYGGIGLIIGAFVSLFGFMGAAFGGNSDAGLLGAIMGVGAIIMLPLFYGFIGFIGGIITAWLYNLVAGWTGGIEVEFDMDFNSTPEVPEPPAL